MQVRLAESAGFCFGVKRAVEMAEQSLQETRPWFSLGSLVHNKYVTGYLHQLGLNEIENVDSIIEPDAGVIIRTHGVDKYTIEKLNAKGYKVVDATCPRVKHIHNLAVGLVQDNFDIVVFGDKEHPEVIGICGWCEQKGQVAASSEEFRSLSLGSKVAVVSQTTRDKNEYYQIIKSIPKDINELRFYNTICTATQKRQEASYQLSFQVDLMLVIGDRKSSNTFVLFKECKKAGVQTYQIENGDEINPKWFEGVQSVGITAGASTPEWIIKEVYNIMTQMDENGVMEQEKELEQTISTESVEEEVSQSNEDLESSKDNQEASEEEVDSVGKAEDISLDIGAEESFAKMEAEMADLNSPSKGDIVKGTVIQVLDDEVMVDVGGKSEGIIPLRELSLKEVASAKELVNIGDEIEVLVLKWDDDGNILLSKKKVDSQKYLDELEEKFNNGETIEGKVTGSVKGGLLVDVGVTAFIPASHIDDTFVKNLDDYIGNTMQFKIIEFNRNKRRGSQVVLSRKEMVAEEKARLKETFCASIKEDQVVKGKIKRIVDYGAFIDLGGYEGLLHVSEIDHYRIDHPSQVFTEGDEIDVYILNLDREKERVSLSRKKMLKSPWEVLTEQYKEDDIIEGTVVRLTSFGAFVELAQGVDGLIHISKLADHRVEKPEEVVSIGERVKTKILALNMEDKKISLSLKNAKQDEERQEVDAFLEQQESEQSQSEEQEVQEQEPELQEENQEVNPAAEEQND